MKYFVVITKYDSLKHKQVKEIAGTFDNYINAELFRDAYNMWYYASAKVHTESDLLN